MKKGAFIVSLLAHSCLLTTSDKQLANAVDLEAATEQDSTTSLEDMFARWREADNKRGRELP